MARLLLCAMPAVGHVTPMLPLAAALVSRGHEVRCYTGEAFRDKVERTGATFEPMVTPLDPGDRALDDLLPALREQTGVAQLKTALKLFFIDSAPGQVADLRRIRAAWPMDAIVSDTAFIGTGLLHELGEGPPWAALSALPLMLSSRDTAPFGPGIPPLGGAPGRLRNAVLRTLVGRVVMRDVTAHANVRRAGLGLPPRTELIFDGALSPFLYLQAGVESLEYPRSDLPAQVHFVGPMQDKAVPAFDPPAWWGEVTAATRPVVHVTQGTVTTGADQLLTPTIRALADEDVLVVATTGGPPVETLGVLPANVRAAAFIPHAALLPHVSAMVTNGGFGAVQLALAHAVPLVVAGATEDKPEVANRVAFAGAGLNLRTGRPKEQAIRQAVTRLLTEPRFRAAARMIAQDMAGHDGPRDAGILIEQLATTGRPVLRGGQPTPLTMTADNRPGR
jgi:UDP:flavonoid glycosyltransferase YjiC (YdhE family)